MKVLCSVLGFGLLISYYYYYYYYSILPSLSHSPHSTSRSQTSSPKNTTSINNSTKISAKSPLGAIVLLAPQRNEGSIWATDRFCLLLRAIRSVDQHLNARFGPYPIFLLVSRDYEFDPSGNDAPYTDDDRAVPRKWAPHSNLIFV